MDEAEKTKTHVTAHAGVRRSNTRLTTSTRFNPTFPAGNSGRGLGRGWETLQALTQTERRLWVPLPATTGLSVWVSSSRPPLDGDNKPLLLLLLCVTEGLSADAGDVRVRRSPRGQGRDLQDRTRQPGQRARFRAEVEPISPRWMHPPTPSREADMWYSGRVT